VSDEAAWRESATGTSPAVFRAGNASSPEVGFGMVDMVLIVFFLALVIFLWFENYTSVVPVVGTVLRVYYAPDQAVTCGFQLVFDIVCRRAIVTFLSGIPTVIGFVMKRVYDTTLTILVNVLLGTYHWYDEFILRVCYATGLIVVVLFMPLLTKTLLDFRKLRQWVMILTFFNMFSLPMAEACELSIVGVLQCDLSFVGMNGVCTLGFYLFFAMCVYAVFRMLIVRIGTSMTATYRYHMFDEYEHSNEEHGVAHWMGFPRRRAGDIQQQPTMIILADWYVDWSTWSEIEFLRRESYFYAFGYRTWLRAKRDNPLKFGGYVSRQSLTKRCRTWILGSYLDFGLCTRMIPVLIPVSFYSNVLLGAMGVTFGVVVEKWFHVYMDLPTCASGSGCTTAVSGVLSLPVMLALSYVYWVSATPHKHSLSKRINRQSARVRRSAPRVVRAAALCVVDLVAVGALTVVSGASFPVGNALVMMDPPHVDTLDIDGAFLNSDRYYGFRNGITERLWPLQNADVDNNDDNDEMIDLDDDSEHDKDVAELDKDVAEAEMDDMIGIQKELKMELRVARAEVTAARRKMLHHERRAKICHHESLSASPVFDKAKLRCVLPGNAIVPGYFSGYY
jgi:hypothetical protein